MTRFSLLSTYPPTRCGLATFSASLTAALGATGPEPIRVVRSVDALDATGAALSSGAAIVGELHVDRPDPEYAARLLSIGDVVIVQHEYGIYGGADGSDVIDVLEGLTSPSIVVLHTVLDAPTPGQRDVLERVAAAATAVVVMTEAARTLLAGHYLIDMRRVSVIPHGTPEWKPLKPTHADDRQTVLTWGLIGPSKGLEWGIRAVAALREVEPPIHYEILGETHPKVVAYEGEAYRERMQELARSLGIADRVTFDARYLDADGLAARVLAADLVLLPYDSRIQVTSGVLVEAIAAGRPVVATGFPHARELLEPRAIAEHESPESIAAAVRDVLAHATPNEPHGHLASWSSVAASYRALAHSLLATQKVRTG